MTPTPRPATADPDPDRLALRRARLRGLQALEDARRARDDARERLVRARDTPERQWFQAQAGAWQAATRHPLRTLARAVDALAVVVGLQRFVDTAGPGSSPVVALSLETATVHDPDPSPRPGSASSVGPVTLGALTREAIVARVDTTIAWRTPCVGHARVVVECGAVFGLAHDLPGALLFEMVVTCPESSWTGRAAREVDPRRRLADHAWRPLRVRLPRDLRGSLEIALTCRTPPGVPRLAEWGVWGAPRVASRQTARNMLEAARASRQPAPASPGAPRDVAHAMPNDSAYTRWIAAQTSSNDARRAHAQAVSRLAYRPTFTIITPVHDTPPAWLHACVGSVRHQIYPYWELCLVDDGSASADTHRALDAYENTDARIRILRLPTSGHICAASNAGLDLATGEFVAFLDHDDELSPDALYEVASLLNQQPDLDFIYSDEDKIDEAGAHSEPYYKPDWAPEHFLNFMYTNHLMVLRRTTIETVGRFRQGYEGSQDFDLALRVVSVTDRIGHVARVLYHWRKVAGSAAAQPAAKPWALDAARRALESHVERTHLDADVLEGASPGLFRVRRRIKGRPMVSIVIPTDDRARDVAGTTVALLPHCIRSIHERSTYRDYELVVVDNGNMSAATEAALAAIPHRRVSYRIDGAFNFSHKLNFSVQHASGEHLLILNDDVEVLSPDWIEALLEYSQDPAIGAVGAKLLYPDGRLQHVGVVMGVCGLAAHLHHQAPPNEPGYFGLALGPRNYSAVTGAVMMTRRRTFDRLGGFDERLAIDFNDIDYCLRARAAGLRVVFTPYARLYHLESGTNGARTWNPAEAQLMRERWPAVIADDPYYNPNLGHDHPDPRRGMKS